MDNEKWIMTEVRSLLRKVRSFLIIHYSLSILYSVSALAQTPAPSTLPVGQFLTDSIEIGRPFRYALTFRHPVTEDILFPDSTAFAPFLVREKLFLPTRSDTQISTDSAVYTLVSFETQPQLTLRVPLYIVGPGDCTVVFSSTDTVFFRSRLQTTRLDTLRLETSTQVTPLRQELNYPVLLAVLGAIGLIVGLIYALFARTINQQLAFFRLRRQHRSFLREYNRLVRTLSADSATEVANQAVVRWRNYLESLEQQPYSTMTTPEIVERITNRQPGLPGIGGQDVEEALKTADRMIYGGTYTEQSGESMQLLRTVAIMMYHQRRAVMAAPTAPEPTTGQPTESA
jgi:hypothetical protein